MNVAEFEAQLGKPPLNPKSLLPFQTLTHQIEYMPEDFIVFSNQAGNSQYSVNRQKIGAGTYKYAIVSLTFGYIFTVVSDQTQTGGNTMEFPKLPEWAMTIGMHAVSGFALGFLTAFVGSDGTVLDIWSALKGAIIIGVYGAGKEVLAYLQTKPFTKSTAAKGQMPVEKKLHERML